MTSLNWRVPSRKSCRALGMQETTTPVHSSMQDQMIVPRASAVALDDVAKYTKLLTRMMLTTVRLDPC